MVASSTLQSGASLSLIEGCFTVIAVVSATFWPRWAHRQFGGIEKLLAGLARRKRTAVAVCGLTALLLRTAILPIFPVPLPFIHDDFSFLLAADTFASGRLTNPTPAMWTHFESFHITMNPTYMSMYFPAQGLLLAAGKVLFGHPWFGLLIACALMCACICWMLQGWLPPGWAFLGGMLAVLRLGLFSYWINTYTGAGVIAALGGALVIGAVPRILRSPRPAHGVLMAIGVAILAFSRPYEGVLLCIPVVVLLTKHALTRLRRLTPQGILRFAAVPAVILLSAASWMAYYNYRINGSALTLPYSINRATYSVVPYYVWQHRRPEPAYRHAVMREFYTQAESRSAREIHSFSGYLRNASLKLPAAVLFFAGFGLAVPLIMIRRVVLDRRLRFLVVCVLVLMAGMAIEIFFFPHYLAPFTAVFYAIGLQCMRHLRVWRPRGRPVGMALVRACVVVCVALGGIRLFAQPLHLATGDWRGSKWSQMWYGGDYFGTVRTEIADSLARTPGKHLVLVRYAPGHDPLDEWVYNSPDIDGAQVVWAREMNPSENRQLIDHYGDRRVWLVQPDLKGGDLRPYPDLKRTTESSRQLARTSKSPPYTPN
jgi:hypothetical protein